MYTRPRGGAYTGLGGGMYSGPGGGLYTGPGGGKYTGPDSNPYMAVFPPWPFFAKAFHEMGLIQQADMIENALPKIGYFS